MLRSWNLLRGMRLLFWWQVRFISCFATLIASLCIWMSAFVLFLFAFGEVRRVPGTFLAVYGQLIFSYYTFFLAVFFRLDFMVLHICAFCLTSAIKQCLCCWILCVLLLAFYCICIVTSFFPEASILHRFLQCVWHLGRLLMFSFCCRGFHLSCLHRAPQVIPWLLYGHNSALFLCPIWPMWSLFGYLGRSMR